MKSEILVTGSGGLIGSKFVQSLADRYHFQMLDISHPTNPVDITNFQQLFNSVQNSTAPFLVHFAAYTDVTGAWQQTGDQTGIAYQVNVVGTQNIVKVCQETNKHLIHISTAYVFDGQKKEQYLETDRVHPIEWYGETKAKAEEEVMKSDKPWTILRIDQPFRQDPFVKPDIAHGIAHQLLDHTLPPQFIDHWFGPTVIEDLVKVIEWVFRTNTTGLYHATSGESWNNFEFATKIAELMNSSNQVQSSKLADYLKTSQRPYQQNTALNNQKLASLLDFKLNSVTSALKLVNYSSSAAL